MLQTVPSRLLGAQKAKPMQTPEQAKTQTANTQNPNLKYALPFGKLSDIVFSLPTRRISTTRQGKNGNGPSTSTLLGNALLPVGDSAIEVSIWESGQDTPDGYEVSTSFSFPRNLALPKDNYGKRTREYYEAQDVENGWKYSVIEAFLGFRAEEDKQKKNMSGGGHVRLVKKQNAA
jgi:hypothetical protein